jgi:integrase
VRRTTIFRLEAGRYFHVDRKTLHVTKHIDKNGYERELPLTDRAYESLATQGVDIGPVFQRWAYRKSLRTAAKALGLAPDDLKSLDMRDFRHAAIDHGARKSGHLSGLAYMAGHTNKHTTSRYIHPQIDDAREVPNKRFPSNGPPSGTRTGGGEGSQ